MTATRPRSIAQQTQALLKEAAALEGRSEGKTFQQIAEEQGWGNKSVAQRAYMRAISRIHDEPAREARDRFLTQISEGLAVWFPKMLAGDPTAVLACDRLWRQWRAVQGLDAPTTVRHIVTDPMIAEIEELARELGLNLEAHPVRPPSPGRLDKLALPAGDGGQA